jgi:hypothetical protein
MTFAERMKDIAAKAGEAAQDLGAKGVSASKEFIEKAGNTAQDLGAKGVSASKEFIEKAGNTAQDLGAKGVSASKEFIEKAGNAAQDLGTKGKLLIEIKQLEAKAEKLMEQLGAEVYKALSEQKLPSVSPITPGIKEIFDELDVIQKEIDKKEKESIG